MIDFTALEKSVIHGDDPPKRNPIDTLMWYAIQGLYAMYHSGQIDREHAKKHKASLTALYKTATDTYAAYVSAEKAYNANIAKAGHLRAEMVKAPDERTALLKALQIISAMTGESEIERIVKNAIENQSQMPGTQGSGKAAPAGDTAEERHTS